MKTLTEMKLLLVHINVQQLLMQKSSKLKLESYIKSTQVLTNLIYVMYFKVLVNCAYTRDGDQKIRCTDPFAGSKSIPRLMPILGISLNRDQYWYHENVQKIRILSNPHKKCTRASGSIPGLIQRLKKAWNETNTDT